MQRQELLGAPRVLDETRVVGEVVNTQVAEAILTEDGKVDVSGMGMITFLASDLGNYELGAKAGQAFKYGAALK